MPKKVASAAPVGRTERIISFIGTTKFFWIVVALFGLQSSWIALTARYPQAFDEQFHFGIINFYSHHLSPFLSSQPTSADQFGAITRDPSYLYHYLLSFPLRLIQLFTSNITVQVIWLRLLNIMLFGSSFFIFRRLFSLTKASKALSHTVLLCLALTPVVPLLASQINYDNLMLPAAGLAVYLTASFSWQLRRTKLWSWRQLTLVAIVCLLASLVKYAFLPILVAVVIWLFNDWRWWRRHGRELTPLANPASTKRWLRAIGLLALLLLSASLFVQRYGVNLVKYHTPLPECNQVLSVERCQAYGPWARNYSYHQQHVQLPLNQVLTYPFVWLYHVMNELIFTISSSFNTSGTVDYHVGTQLIVIEILAWTVFGFGLLAVIIYFRRLAADRTLRLFALVGLLYVAALGGQNYLDYLHLGYPVAIHGRYLLPILPLMYLAMALAFRYGLQRLSATDHLAAIRKLTATAIVTALLLFEGGGFVTYILRSDPTWFWPQSSKAQTVNSKARKILKHTVLDVNKN